MTKEKLTIYIGVLALCSAMVHCVHNAATADTTTTPTSASTECTTDLTGYSTGTYQALCTPAAGPGRFFIHQGLNAPSLNGFAYIYAGYASTPTTSSSFAAGQYAMIVGRSSGPVSFSYFRNAAATYSGTEGNGSATPDIYSGSNVEVCGEFVPATGAAPRVVFWATGQNGANCSSRTNLTLATALINFNAFTDSTNALTLGQAYFRFSNTGLFNGQKIIVSSKSVLN